MKKVKTGIRKKTVDYEYEEYCFAIIRYKRKYFIVKENGEYSLIGDLIRDYEGRRECIERIIEDRTDIVLNDCEEYVTIDEYSDYAPNNGIEKFTTYYLIHIDKEFKYIPKGNEELVLVTGEELSKLIQISYQKEAIKILLGTFMFN